MNLRFSEPCDSGSFGSYTLSLLPFQLVLAAGLRTTTCLTSACCGCFTHPSNAVEPLSLFGGTKMWGVWWWHARH